MSVLPIKLPPRPNLDAKRLQEIAQAVDEASRDICGRILDGMPIDEALKDEVERKVKGAIKDAVMKQLDPLVENDVVRQLVNTAVNKAVDKAWDKIKDEIKRQDPRMPVPRSQGNQIVRHDNLATGTGSQTVVPNPRTTGDPIIPSLQSIHTPDQPLQQVPHLVFTGQVTAYIMAPPLMGGRLFHGVRVCNVKPGTGELYINRDRLVFHGKASKDGFIQTDVKTSEIKSFYLNVQPLSIPLLVVGSILTFIGFGCLIGLLSSSALILYLGLVTIPIIVVSIAVGSVLILFGCMHTSVLSIRVTGDLHDLITITMRGFSRGQDYTQFIEQYWAVFGEDRAHKATMNAPPALPDFVAPTLVSSPHLEVAEIPTPSVRHPTIANAQAASTSTGSASTLRVQEVPAPSPLARPGNAPQSVATNLTLSIGQGEVVTPAEVFLCYTCYEDFNTKAELEAHKKREKHD